VNTRGKSHNGFQLIPKDKERKIKFKVIKSNGELAKA